MVESPIKYALLVADVTGYIWTVMGTNMQESAKRKVVILASSGIAVAAMLGAVHLINVGLLRYRARYQKAVEIACRSSRSC